MGIAYLEVSPEILLSQLKHGTPETTITMHPVHEDATVAARSCYYNLDTGNLVLAIEHESYEHGCRIQHPVFTEPTQVRT